MLFQFLEFYNGIDRFPREEFLMKKIYIMLSFILVFIALLISCSGNAAQTTATGVAATTTSPVATTPPATAVQRGNVITLLGQSMTLLGPEIKVGQKAPGFKLVAPYPKIEVFSSANMVDFSRSRGRVRVISVVPSLDTPVCDLQTQRFEAEAVNFPQVEFYTISVDLPFAQARYCGARDVSHMQVLSDYYDNSFGLSYGVLIKELRLLSRSIFIVDGNDVVQYVEYVKEISQPPNYETVLANLRTLTGTPTTSPAATTAPISPTASQLTPTATVSPTQTTATAALQVGSPAPAFQLADQNGQVVSLASLKGKPVLLNFWATWCPFCQAERPAIQQIYNNWQSKGLVVLTADLIGTLPTETSANLISFMNSHGYTFPVLMDTNAAVAKAYGVKATPTNVLIDKNGIIFEIQVGGYPSLAAEEASLTQLLTR
jgi:thioredoxin-dependent peroxiredoxin